MLAELRFLLHITRSHGIVRRYFVVNGFDGALTTLGLIMGFYVSDGVDLDIVATACLGALIALGMSGLSSAYISEAAERRRALVELEEAMATDLGESAHGRAARLVPWLIAAVNGIAPLLIGLLILLPIWLAQLGHGLPMGALESAIVAAFILIFLLGAFLGRVGRTSWLMAGIKTLLIAIGTAMLVYMLG